MALRNIVKIDDYPNSDKMHFHFYLAQLAVLVEVNTRGRKKEGGALPDNTNLLPPPLKPPAAS